MDIQDKFANIGGSLGSICAFFLNVNLIHIVEIGIYALVGGLVGEGVKEAVNFVKKKKG